MRKKKIEELQEEIRAKNIVITNQSDIIKEKEERISALKKIMKIQELRLKLSDLIINNFKKTIEMEEKK